MADISVTAANVKPSGNAVTQQGTAGATITQGQLVYLDSATNTIKLCHGSTSLATATCVGVALESVVATQPLLYQTLGDYTCGATLTVGEPYFTSTNNAGGIMPKTDIATGYFTVCWGIAISTTVLTILNKGGSTLTAHG